MKRILILVTLFTVLFGCVTAILFTTISISAGTYRNMDTLPDGAVVVVGSGQSGCQIAEELRMAVLIVTRLTVNSTRQHRSACEALYALREASYSLPGKDKSLLPNRVILTYGHYVK